MNQDEFPDTPSHELSELDDSVSVDSVINVALKHFADDGFQDTKLDTIARNSGMSKRMIHYHFGDKQGLYRRCLLEAFSRIHPAPEDMAEDATVPVEGVTKLVGAVYLKMSCHPEAIRLLSMESLHDILTVTELSTLANHSEVLLHLDKLLMMGQDSGAFRPGISTEDLFFLIWSLTFFRVGNRDIMVNIFNVDTTSEANTQGIHRLTVDTVLAFLTSNIPDTGHRSYVTSGRDADHQQSGLGIYGSEDNQVL